MFYKRHELQWRINLFFSASILAGAFSGLLAYAIAHMAGIAGYEGWRWIFILGRFSLVRHRPWFRDFGSVKVDWTFCSLSILVFSI